MDNQKPVVHIHPESKRTLGGAAADFGASFGIVLDEWQRIVVDDWLALDENGKWAAGTCGLSVPRQNGKTAAVKVRAMYGACALGETILFTAHEVKTSRNTFEQLAELFDENGMYPDLASSVLSIRRANGQEEIRLQDWQDDDGEWHKGGAIIFSARSRGAARGFTVDCVIADEAMSMTDEQAAALMPTMSSAAGGDSQLILIGTPPSPGDIGTVFASTRESAFNGDKGISWCEWSVDEIGDVYDWDRIVRCNPSIGKRLMRKAVESELSVMAPDYFARERLGWWDGISVNNVMTEREWDACREESPNTDGVRSYACKFRADGARVAVAVAVKREDGSMFTELLFDEPTDRGLQWLLEWMVPRSKSAAQVVVDGMANAQTFSERLVAAGCPKKAVMRPRSYEAVAAYSGLLNHVRERTVHHAGQESLKASATKTTRRDIGQNGGWGFRSSNEADAAPIEAAAFAVWAAEHTKRDPNRKMRVG